MGIVESRVLAQDVLAACQRAESEGKSKLNEKSLWSNKDTLKALKDIYEYIPKNIRCKPRQSVIKKAITRSKTCLTVPPAIQELQDKHEELFPAGSSNHDVSSTAFSPKTNPLVLYYSQVVFYEKRQTLDRIRLRLLYVALYRVKQEVQPGHQYEYYDPTFIAQAIFQSGCFDDQLDVITSKVRTWISLGERYNLIAEDLEGLGALYILPNLGGESVWSKELPKSPVNQHRISMIQFLKNQGICEEARRRNLHELAENEVLRFTKPLKETLESAFRQSQSGTEHISFQGQPQINPRPGEVPSNTFHDSQPLEPQQLAMSASTRNQSGCTVSHLMTQIEDNAMNTGKSPVALNIRPCIRELPGGNNQRVSPDGFQDSLNQPVYNQQPLAVPHEAGQLAQRPNVIETEAFNLQPFIQRAPLHRTQRGLGQQLYPPHAVTPGENQISQQCVHLGSGLFNLQPFIQQPPLHGSQGDFGLQLYASHTVTPDGTQNSHSSTDTDGRTFNLQPFIQQPPLHGSQGDLGPQLYASYAESPGGNPISQVASNPYRGLFNLHAFIQQPLVHESQGVIGDQSYAGDTVTTATDQSSQLSSVAGPAAFSSQFHTQQPEHRSWETPGQQYYASTTATRGMSQFGQRSSTLDTLEFDPHSHDQQPTGHELQSIFVQ
ncbi:uncharacterized protein BDW70DRAFT_165121 [Aspergillus foveolatus]|uniref:uncharacterized protein n=1 Tax=Aspergillus foveolatus TaxID=210207 RepID=UPI003CCCD92A